MDNGAKNILNKNLIKNDLQNKVVIFDKAETNFLENSFPRKLKLKNCFFLIDIEEMNLNY